METKIKKAIYISLVDDGFLKQLYATMNIELVSLQWAKVVLVHPMG